MGRRPGTPPPFVGSAAHVPDGRPRRWVRGALPPAELPWILVVQTLTYTIGTGFYLAGSVIFFTVYAGLTPGQVASGMSLAALLRLGLQLPCGMLSDRIGGRRAWLVGAAGQAGLFALYPWLHGFWPFLAVIAAVAVASCVGGAGRSRYLGEIIPADRRVAVNAYLKSVLNIGFAVGTAGTGLLIGVHSRRALAAVVLANAATFAFDVVLLLAGSRLGSGDWRPRTVRKGQRGALRDRPFVALAAIQAVFALSDNVLSFALPLWILRRTDAPRSAIPAVLLVNMAMAATLQMRAARGSEDIAVAARRQRHGGLLLSAACLLVPVSHYVHGTGTWPALAAAVVVLTLGELLAAGAATALSYGLSPAARRGEYLAVFTWGTRLADVVAPAGLAALTLPAAGQGWLPLAALFAAAALLTPPAVARLLRSRLPAGQQAAGRL